MLAGISTLPAGEYEEARLLWMGGDSAAEEKRFASFSSADGAD